MRAIGLFAGIGGIELGLQAAGHEAVLLCEIEPHARAVLEERFPEIECARDVTKLTGLPSADLLAGGFPCQDLSQAGRTAGIGGKHSGLVTHVFELLGREVRPPEWLLLENVPFMLQLDRGGAMRYLVSELERLGYSWAYRVVDTRAFGLPQRRQRVLLVASRSGDPRTVLFADDAREPEQAAPESLACGFYWTEGLRGLGWAVDAVPTLKGGSTIGIPSPPAIRMPDGTIVTPDIRDAERLQGFDTDWTAPALDVDGRRSRGARWKLVGNAVSVPVAEWVGKRLAEPGAYDGSNDSALSREVPWPRAAWGGDGEAFKSSVSMWPVRRSYRHLHEFLEFPTTPLSLRATAGFYSRTQVAKLRFPEGFIHHVQAHLRRMETPEDVAA